jgi:hypothetical protein
MDEHTEKYYSLIDHSIDYLIKSANNPKAFEKHFLELQAVVPTYGLTLPQINILLNIIINPHSKFKNPLKNKMIDLLIPRELLDFNTILRIFSIFKVTSYYNEKSKIKIIPRTIQIKLSTFLIKNYVNIKWEPKFLNLLNFIFGILSIGYLRSNIGLFLIYTLNISSEIDPNYNIQMFFNQKKLNLILEFYDLDPKTSMPLVIYATSFLNSIERNNNFDLILQKYNILLQNVKISKDLFGKLDAPYINSISEKMKEHNNEIIIFQKNVQMCIQMLHNLNSLCYLILNGHKSRKRKYLQEAPDFYDFVKLTNIYSIKTLCVTLTDSSLDTNIIELLKYFSTLDGDNFNEKLPNNIILPDVTYNTPVLSLFLQNLSKINIELLNFKIMKLLNIKTNGDFKPSKDSFWVFEGIYNIICFSGMTLPIITELFSEQVYLKNESMIDDYLQSINAFNLVQFLEPDYKKFEKMIHKILDNIFKFNSIEKIKGIVLLLSNWIKSPLNFNKLISNVLKRFKYENLDLINEILIMCLLMHELPYSSIDVEILVLKPDIVALIFFSGNLYQLNLLLQHILFCKTYYANYGIGQLEGSQSNKLKRIKELHNSYVLNICNCLWRGKLLDQTKFKFPVEFLKKLKFDKPMNLVNLPTIKSLIGIDINYDTDSDELDKQNLVVYERLKAESFNGICNFLQNSIRSLQR